MNFCCIGVSYRNACEEIRDHAAFTPESAVAFMDRAASAGVAQCAVLSTCNRSEVFIWGDEGAGERILGLYRSEFPEVPAGAIVRRDGDTALEYLFRIAAGLESMIVGEYQILGQVKDAYSAAQSAGHVGKELDRIIRDAITCAKRVKTELDIGAVPPSVCRAGVEYVDSAFGIAGKRVFVIGSGKTGTLAVRIARSCGADSISVCNRSPERTKRLVDGYGAISVGYESRYHVIAESDIVISATASPHVVVAADRLALNHSVVFLDLASPCDVDRKIAGNPLATLIGIDTIGELSAGNLAERRRLTAKGMEIIGAFISETREWLGRDGRRRE